MVLRERERRGPFCVFPQTALLLGFLLLLKRRLLGPNDFRADFGLAFGPDDVGLSSFDLSDLSLHLSISPFSQPPPQRLIESDLWGRFNRRTLVSQGRKINSPAPFENPWLHQKSTNKFHRVLIWRIPCTSGFHGCRGTLLSVGSSCKPLAEDVPEKE